MRNKLLGMGIALLAGVMVLSGCAAATDNGNPVTPTGSVPAYDPGKNGVLVEISIDDMDAQTNIAQSVDVTNGQSIVVSLPTNASTGFSWTEAVIGDAAVLTQYERNEVPAANGLAGASGKSVWTFKTLKAGQTTVKTEYSRPWEGGEKGAKTFTLTVTVK